MLTRFSMAGGNGGNRLLSGPHLRMCSATKFGDSLKESLRRSANDDQQTFEKRPSRRRYSAANTTGRSKNIRGIISLLKSLPKTEKAAIFDGLHPRDKLDVLRVLGRRSARRAAGFPRIEAVSLREVTYLGKRIYASKVHLAVVPVVRRQTDECKLL
ncbi:hypothetical protein C3747_104g133 [Trypanosoma cruzi]|uniref:Uncharacterized protein n=1 Tax=Trypanosoma cruzi TaxID=5693 RepID=A0A2V2WFV9_TRYCR|nr:hypothetical protein C3747_104g133 [Trypanosoma cruzi]